MQPSSSVLSSVEPLSPGWLQALLPLLQRSLEVTAGRENVSEVTITFDASDPNTAKWNETISRRVTINLATRTIEKGTQSIFAQESPEESLRRATTLISQIGTKIRADLKIDAVGCQQMSLVFKEGRLTGVKTTRSIPLRNQRRKS